MKQLILILMALLLVTACKNPPNKVADTEDLAAVTIQNLNTDVTITLNVNAAELYKLTNPPSSVIDTLCVLSDNNNPPGVFKGNLKDFETIVKPNYSIEWVGENDTVNEFTVKIYCIVNDNNKEDKNILRPERAKFFERIALSEDNGGRVRGKVKDKIEGPIWNFYWIYFRIYEDENNYKDYRIDPRLKIE